MKKNSIFLVVGGLIIISLLAYPIITKQIEVNKAKAEMERQSENLKKASEELMKEEPIKI